MPIRNVAAPMNSSVFRYSRNADFDTSARNGARTASCLCVSYDRETCINARTMMTALVEDGPYSDSSPNSESAIVAE